MPKRVKDEDRYQIDKKTGCWNYLMSISPTTGYGQIHINLGKYKYKNLTAHQYFYEKYRKKVELGYELDHLCRNRQCCNPYHLEEVSCAENVRRGLVAKLNWSKVHKIKNLYEQGLNQYKIAAIFNINQSQVSRIINGLRWEETVYA